MPGDPFQIDILPKTPLTRAAIAAARPVLEWVLALGEYRKIYESVHVGTTEPFEARALRALEVLPQTSGDDISRIPMSGPLIVAANHPHGLLDGLVLIDLVRRARPDIRVLTNHLLARIPELRELCLFVDPFNGPDAAARSRAGLRAAHLWLRKGGALIVFPAGEVAHVRGQDGAFAESSWKPTMSRLAIATGAQVVPAFIEGGNSRLFYVAGQIHSSLRTMMLARELLKKRGATVTVRFGNPISRTDVSQDVDATTARVRTAMETLVPTVRPMDGTTYEPGFGQTDSIAAEIAGLRADLLVESGPFQVFCVRADQIPATLREIGRLRELTYRAIGEGTGRTIDLDRFDSAYRHLFSWDRDRRRVVGAYRIGQTDRIVQAGGVDGLYTRTLFRYDERLIDRMAAPALELGRSFVRAEYQKNYNALLLLWKGIGSFIARHPRYRLLFGPVSISTRYSDSSHQLLMSFLQQNHFAAELSELVEAFNPPAGVAGPPASSVPVTIGAVDRLVACAESDGKGMPVLLRQYLKLNARVIGFSVDPNFGEALDALMVVDLTTVDRAILNRYLGRRDADQFLACHREIASAA
jgi:putative hemolysin